MKRSDLFIRLTTAALFLAVVCYIGFSVYGRLGTSFETAAAIALTVEETGGAAGYIVREETVVQGGSSGVSPVARDGEKVGAGHVVAIGYRSGDALRRAGELRELKLKLEQLEATAGTSAAQSAALAADSVTELAVVLREGRLLYLDEALIRVESRVMTGASALTADDLPALREQMAALEAQSAGDTTVRAPVSGVYSHVVDGYEGVGPGKLSGLTPAGLSELFSAPDAVTSDAAGKLITGIRWYYAAVVSQDDTRRLSVGKETQVRFKGDYQGAAMMRVDSVGRIENGECVVVFSCAGAIADVTGARQIEAEVVFSTFTGIRVPKEAIHLGDDGKTYVYLQTGAQAEQIEVNILTEFGDSYLAVDTDKEARLREGARIITKANDIDDGKVVIG